RTSICTFQRESSRLGLLSYGFQPLSSFASASRAVRAAVAGSGLSSPPLTGAEAPSRLSRLSTSAARTGCRSIGVPFAGRQTCQQAKSWPERSLLALTTEYYTTGAVSG